MLAGGEVLATAKVLTTEDVSSGILGALEVVLAERPGLERQVQAVMLGTTQFTNAVAERRQLAEVAAVRAALPSGRGLPPKVDWPEDIAACLGANTYLVKGGTLYDGWPLADIEDREIDSVIADLKAAKVRAVAVSAAFSPMNPASEIAIGERIQAAIPEMRISLSHKIGRLGILERENAALLNASLLDFADSVVASFTDALQRRGLGCPFFISQNDGTLMEADFARRFPALTFASGPTNSLRGAARLAGVKDAIVVDIGGTTSDIGALRGGFPRESSTHTEVGGVRTNFRMPDLLTLALGGGSLVHEGGVQVGPHSLGHKLVRDGLAFGGEAMTATDILVAAGRMRIGDPALVRHIAPKTIAAATGEMRRMLLAGVERMQSGSAELPIVLVGGGVALAAEPLADAGEILIPKHSEVANAIGAAVAQIGAEAERLLAYDRIGRQQALEQVRAEAMRKAVQAGADPATVRVADVEETSISYMADNMTRLRIKAVGEIGRLKTQRPAKETA